MSIEKMIPASDSPVLVYVQLIRAAEFLHAQVTQGLLDEGLTASQFSTMKVLRMKGALPQKEIASYLLKTGGNVTLVVDNLVRRKLVFRGSDPNDRRVALVELTPLGIATFDRIYPHHLSRIRAAMAGLKEMDLESLSDLLTSLAQSPAPVCATEPATTPEKVGV
jgi:MarR family transcriptional regulator, 2-MHQ and catechol-resistance regulon repressor